MKLKLPDNTELYECLVIGLGESPTKFQQWWDTMSSKYQWESAPNGNWGIDFQTNEIILVS